jgi:PEP-CTERM motif
MKISAVLSLTLAVMPCLVSTSQAALIAYEGFDYTAGANALSGKNGGTGWSGAWSAVDNNIVSPGLSYSTLQTSGNYAVTDANGFGDGSVRLFSSAQSGTIWFSGLVQSNNSGSGFVGLNLIDSSNNNGALGFGQRFNQANLDLYGDRTNGAQQQSSGISSSSLSFVAAEINLSAGTVTWYVNPTGLGSGSAPTGSSFTGSTTFSSFTAIGVGLRGNTSANFDEIRIGTTWQDVSPTAVPEPSTYASIAGAGILGFALLRRRRAD